MVLRNLTIRHQRLQDRRRIGQARGLDQHPVIEQSPPRPAAARKSSNVANRSARTAQHRHPVLSVSSCLVARRDQFVVQADFAELVDDHRGARERGIAQQARDQRRLAAAEKPGDDGDRQHARSARPRRPRPALRRCHRSSLHRQRRIHRPFRQRSVVQLHVGMPKHHQCQRISARRNAPAAIGDDSLVQRANARQSACAIRPPAGTRWFRDQADVPRAG